MNWIIENKEWLFSGIGVTVISLVTAFIISGKKKDENGKQVSSPSNTPTADNGGINIIANGDVNFSKDTGKSTMIKNSTIGVVGDNTTVNGGIDLNDKNT